MAKSSIAKTRASLKSGPDASKAEPEEQASPIVGIGIRMPRSLHDELRRISYETRVSLNSLLLKGVEHVIAEDKKQ